MTRHSRRTFLAATAGLTSALAGCGYRHGGGDVHWSTAAPGGLFAPDQYLWTDSYLVARSRSERHYDFDANSWLDGGQLHTTYLADGASGWEFSGGSAYLTMAAGGDTVYVGTGGLRVHAVRGGGEEWEAPVDAPPVALARGGETVYAVTDEGTLHALAAANGTPRWRVDVGEGFAGTLVADESGAFAVRAGSGGGVTALGTDGGRRWEWADAAPRDDVPPTVTGGTLYLPSRSGLVALDAASGTERWRGEGGGSPRGSPEALDETVYYSTSGGVSAYDAESGDRRWEMGRPTTPPAVVGDRLVVGANGAVVGYDAGEGRRLWRESVDGGGVTATARDGTAVVVTGEGRIRAYEP